MLEQLNSKGLLTNKGLSNFIISQQQEQEPPLYLRALLGVGAFIALLCFIHFLEGADIIIINRDHRIELILWGLAFVAGAIGLQSIAGDDHTVKHSFFVQSSFALMVMGKSLFVLGVSHVLVSEWGISLALLMITGITYHIYRISIDRFLSSFAVLLSILINILWNREVIGFRELLLNGFFLLQFAGAAILLTHGKIKHDYIPLSYAFVFSLCVIVLLLAFFTEFGSWKHKELIHPAFMNMLLTGGLIALFSWAAGGIEKFKCEPLILVSIGAVLLGLISAPGILLTIGLMVLGYAKHEKFLLISGALLMPVFLFLYYYNLDISLMQKSGILIGSGAVLLASRFYLKYKGWDDGGASCAQK